MITPKKIYELHKNLYGEYEEGEVLHCPYCGKEFQAWFGCLGQAVRGKKNSCCKLCLDKMKHTFENNRIQLMEEFHTGFKSKRDGKAFKKLSYKEKVKYIREVLDYGIAIYSVG